LLPTWLAPVAREGSSEMGRNQNTKDQSLLSGHLGLTENLIWREWMPSEVFVFVYTAFLDHGGLGDSRGKKETRGIWGGG
jgi:hypothetical protein